MYLVSPGSSSRRVIYRSRARSLRVFPLSRARVWRRRSRPRAMPSSEPKRASSRAPRRGPSPPPVPPPRRERRPGRLHRGTPSVSPARPPVFLPRRRFEVHAAGPVRVAPAADPGAGPRAAPPPPATHPACRPPPLTLPPGADARTRESSSRRARLPTFPCLFARPMGPPPSVRRPAASSDPSFRRPDALSIHALLAHSVYIGRGDSLRRGRGVHPPRRGVPRRERERRGGVPAVRPPPRVRDGFFRDAR